MPLQPLVSVLILNWNQRDLTLQCLASLQAVTYPRFTVVCVDNGSTDGSAAAIRNAFPDIRLLALPENLLFAGGNNAGIQRALEDGADFVLLLNNDTTVDAPFLDHLVRRFQSTPHCGMVVPKILYHSDPERIWYAGGEISFWTGTMRHTGIRRPDDGHYDTARPVEYASGCCLLVSREVIAAVGSLDESYRIYAEDADWSLRTRNAGYSIWYEPAARIWHKISVTTGGHLSWFKMSNKFRSNFRFFARHASWYHWLTFPWLNLGVNAAAALRYVLEQRTTDGIRQTPR